MALRSWTRRQLEREARRLGLAFDADTSRMALLVAIGERRSSALRLARGFLSAAIDVAGGTLRPRLSALAPIRGAALRPAAPPPPRPPAAPLVTPSEPPSGPPSSPDRPLMEAPERPSEPLTEPIQTRTMARLLARQGHRERARAILEALLERDPADETLRQELESLSAGSRPTPALAPTARGEQESPREAQPREAQVALVRAAPDRVVVCWDLSEAEIERIRSRFAERAGACARLEARLVIVSSDGAGAVSRRTRSRAAERRGEWIVQELPSRARATAAVGLAEGGRFVSIAHSRVLAL
ncbi:MAG: hypothetical protein OEY14_03310 [Myxococcales bacterium]|nr:hypothetical protein [Myxococcales bacterium]